MSGLFPIFRRELASLFLSPLAWVLFCLTLFYNAFFFLYYLERETGGEVNLALANTLGGALPFWILVALLAPLLTMRMISEESRNGLLEFLLTAPVSDAAVVVGKAMAVTTFLAAVWLCVPVYGLFAQALGAAPDWGVVFTGWIGTLLVSALFSAIGLVASALSSTPLVAAFLGTVVNLVVFFLPQLALGGAAGRTEWVRWAVEKVDVLAHFQGSFQTGALDSAHVVFFVAWTGALLFLAVRAVGSRRWL